MPGPFKMKGWSPFTKNTHPDHSVTPPTKEESEKSKGTLEGKTQFETDIIPVTNVIKGQVKKLKKVYVDNPKKVIQKVKKKIHKYFTEK